jgi:hypothetical protein
MPRKASPPPIYFIFCGLYADTHLGKANKVSRVLVALMMIDEEPKPVPSTNCAEMIRKVYELGPLVCPRCGCRMKVIALLAGLFHRTPDHVASGVVLCCGAAAACPCL